MAWIIPKASRSPNNEAAGNALSLRGRAVRTFYKTGVADLPAGRLSALRGPCGPLVHGFARDFIKLEKFTAIMGFTYEHEFAKEHFVQEIVHGAALCHQVRHYERSEEKKRVHRYGFATGGRATSIFSLDANE